MIAKKVPNPKKSASKSERVGGLADYVTAPERENGLEKCIHCEAENFLTGTLDAQKLEMIALSQEGVKSKDPIDHWVLSWHHDEHPTPQQAKQAVALFIDHCGLTGHQYLWGLHDDTENLHVHIAVNRVNPDTLKVIKINKGFDKEASQQAIALIEHAQGWRKEVNARYNIENGKPVLSEKGAIAKNYGKPLEPGSTAKAMELQTGEKSAERIGIESAAPIIKNAVSWKQLHADLAAIGIRYERDGSGAKVYVGEIGIKASDVDRKASFGALQKRLGAYQPAKEIHLNDYHHHTPQPYPAAPGENARHGLRNLSECRLAHPEKGQQASRAGVLHVDARADRPGTGGLRRAAGPGNSSGLAPQPLRPGQPGWKEYIVIRDTQKSAKNFDATVLQQRHGAEWAALLAKLKAERDAVLTGNWKGKGDLRNAMQSILATQQAAEKLALSEQHRAERKALQAQYKPLPQYKQWKEQPLIVGEAARSLVDQRITRDQQPARLSEFIKALTHTVDQRLHVTYQLNGRDLFRDEGRTIRVLDLTSNAGIAAALAVAQQKYGNRLTLTGSPAFQQKAVAVAVANNLTCRFADPALDALRERLTTEKYQAERTAERAAEVRVGAERVLAKEKAAQPRNIERTPAVSPSMLNRPAQRAAAPTAEMPVVQLPPAPPTEAEQEQTYARARLAAEAVKNEAYQVLTVVLQGQGKEVRKIKDSMLYSGKIIAITEDGRFAVQNLGRNAVAIHDLAQLDGSYTSGQGANIQYREGRGQDKLQGRQRESPGCGR